MIQALKAWGPAVLWAAVLFLLSELPGLPAGTDFPLADKAGHFVLYGILGAALGWGRWVAGPGSAPPHWALLAAGWAYGAVDEWHQSFVPARTPDAADFLVDVLGVVFGYVLLLFLARKTEASALPGSPAPGSSNHDHSRRAR